MGGMGRERIHNMKHDFKFISKHSPQVKSAYSDLMEILSLVHDDLRKQYTFQHEPVGSYSRNMITYDAKSNIGFDFDINIYPNDEENRFTAKQIRNKGGVFFSPACSDISHFQNALKDISN